MISHLYHGSKISGLKVLNAEKGRFGDKIFATDSYQRALSYLGGGSGVLENQGRLFVLDLDPGKLKNQTGSIYTVDSRDFALDDHKGAQHRWVYSIQDPQPVIKEVVVKDVASGWRENRIFPVSPAQSNVFRKLVKSGSTDRIQSLFDQIAKMRT